MRAPSLTSRHNELQSAILRHLLLSCFPSCTFSLSFLPPPPSKDEVQPAAVPPPEPGRAGVRGRRLPHCASSQDVALNSTLATHFQPGRPSATLLANHTTHSLFKHLPPRAPTLSAATVNLRRPGWWREGGPKKTCYLCYLSLGWHHFSELKQTH